MISHSDRLRYLLARDAFAICPLLTVRDFISFSKDRGVETTEEQLERLEKLGLLYPFARVKWPRVTRKIETIDEGRRYRDHGILQPGETWDGETRKEWGRWRLDPPDVLELLDEGHMWDPRNSDFIPWASYRDGHETHTETFYSMFQCFPLEWKLMWLSARCDASIFADGADPVKIGEQLAQFGTHTVDAVRTATHHDDIAFVAQAISTRYYPLTRTDRRTFTLQDRRFGWDWYGFVTAWDGTGVASELTISEDDVQRQHQTVAMLAQSRDPLDRWYQLVRFVSVDKKDKLKGTAQYAQLLYSMEHMLRLFAFAAYGVALHPPDEGPTWKNEDLYGKGIPDDPLRHLEFVVNDYHLNPRPKLILVVEGPGEELAIPRIAEDALGHAFPTLGIEVRTLGGVGEYTGSKKHDKRGALEKFIDDYHYRQTLVIIVLDKEGRVDPVTKRLIEARSKLYPSRMLTCPEYIRLWNRNIEFDNWSPDEIAAAMSAQANGAYTFSEAEIITTRNEYDSGKGDPLSRLYLEKVGHDLDKVACLEKLAEILIAAVETIPYAERPKARPLLQVLDEIINLAALNHQPVTHDTWKLNQESGYFGKVVTNP
jgi:hypothetical protein